MLPVCVYSVGDGSWCCRCRGAAGPTVITPWSRLVMGLGKVIPETLYEREDALSIKPVMHYQGTAYLCY